MIVYLHIGTPKSGTSYLQDICLLNRERLAADGVLWPGREWGDQVRAVQETRGSVGRSRLTQILRGGRARDLLAAGHHRLESHGQLAHRTESQVLRRGCHAGCS